MRAAVRPPASSGRTPAGGAARGALALARAAALAVAVLLAVPPAVLAHGDVRLADGPIALAPGASATFEGTLHFHRLVGRVTAGGPVVVRLVRSDTGTAVFEAGPGDVVAFNQLIACCLDRGWTPHTLVIENVGGAPLAAHARAGLVHDDLAVMVYGAESGTSESVVIIGVAWAAVLWWSVRRRPAALLRRAAATFAAVMGAILGLAWYGGARYGAGGVPALVAGLSDVPVLPANPLVSNTTLLIGVLLLGWAVAGALWARSRPEAGPAAGRLLWLGLAAGLVGAVALAAVLMVAAYDTAPVALASALAAAVPVLVVAAGGLRLPPARWLAAARAARRT